MDSSELNRMLLERMEEVCQYLLPNGKAKGCHYLVGGLDGSAGDSLQITFSGAAAGRYIDFAHPEDKGGTPLWLWSKTKGISFKQAITEAKEWLGVRDEDFGIRRHRSRSYQKPGKALIKLAEPNSPIMDYLTVARRLDPLVLANAKVCESEDGTEIAFPYIEADPETGNPICVHRKYLKLERVNGKKQMWATNGTKRCLYAKQLISENVSEVTICEGEIDALTWASWSVPAVSVPNGVSDFEWVDNDWEWLERFERINVCMDMDEPGQLAAREVCKRLGLHRCYIVSLPHKDANDCLVAGLKREDALKCLAAAKAIELDEIKRPNEFTDEVMDLYSTEWEKRGWETPWWPELPWRVRKGEFTVLSGFSGHGKTLALNQLMLDLVRQGARVMDASLEVKPGMTLYNMSRCALGKKDGTETEIRGCIDWVSEYMFFLDCIGTVNIERLLHAMEYARKRHGIDVFIIDSLFKCGLGSEDYGAQREFIDKLTTFVNNTNAHVILVAHSRKVSTGNELSVPSKSDVAGSSDITNGAFNVVIWFRYKLKKQKLDEARQAVPADDETIMKWIDHPDGQIFLDKQRFGEGEEARVNVWLDFASYQFHTHRNTRISYFPIAA